MLSIDADIESTHVVAGEGELKTAAVSELERFYNIMFELPL